MLTIIPWVQISFLGPQLRECHLNDVHATDRNIMSLYGAVIDQ